MDKVYHAAKYIRSSCATNEELQNNTIEHQSLIIDRFLLEYPNIVAVSERIDENISGVTFERPAFKKMAADILNGKINCVICKDLTRLGRSYIEAGYYLRNFFPSHGVRFISINDNIDTCLNNIEGDMLVSLKNILSEEYCRDISIKTRSALNTLRRQGDCVSASAIYGYQKCKDDKHKLIRDEYASGIVKSIFIMKLQGMSAAQIASNLNESNIMSPLLYKRGANISADRENSRWHASTVFRILKDENYTGTLVQGRQSICNYKIRKVVNRPQCEWIKTIDAHEAIISHNDFEQVQRLFQLDTRSAPGEKRVHPLSGLLICACCGSNMKRKTIKLVSGTYIYYSCTTEKRNGCFTAGRIKEDKLYAGVIELVEVYVRQISIIDPVKNAEQISQSMRYQQIQQITESEEMIERNNLFKSGLSDSLVDGIISQEEFIQFNSAYNARNETLQNAINALDSVYTS